MTAPLDIAALRGLLERGDLLARTRRWYAEMERSADELAKAHPSLRDAAGGTRKVANVLGDCIEIVNSLPALLARVAELEAMARAIVDGDVPRPVGKRWRADGKPSKLDECAHGLGMREECANCNEAFITATLTKEPTVERTAK